MKVFGIILEANPLHFGHQYFIKQIHATYHPDILIAIISTSFTMRGEISLLDKFTKTRLLLNEGIDIILELPFSLSVQSADYFAKNCLTILNQFQITDLAFGSETRDLNLYQRLYQFMTDIKPHILQTKKYSKKQLINQLLLSSNFTQNEIDMINLPNFTLGFQYIKTINDSHYPINYHLIQRVANNYYDQVATSNIASGTTIRHLLKEKKDISFYLPYNQCYLIDLNQAEKKLLLLFEYEYMIKHNLEPTYFSYKEGIHNYIRKKGIFKFDLETLQKSLKNKKYTISHLNRSMLHMLLHTKEIEHSIYLRILGITPSGIKYLNGLPNSTKASIFSSPKELVKCQNNVKTQKILAYELQATQLYQLLSSKDDLYLNEFKLPIRKDK